LVWIVLFLFQLPICGSNTILATNANHTLII
jgi:hypothetical protein